MFRAGAIERVFIWVLIWGIMSLQVWRNPGDGVLRKSGAGVYKCAECPCDGNPECGACTSGRAPPYVKVSVSGLVGKEGYECTDGCADSGEYSGDFILPFEECVLDVDYAGGNDIWRARWRLEFDFTYNGDCSRCEIYLQHSYIPATSEGSMLVYLRFDGTGSSPCLIAWRFETNFDSMQDCVNWSDVSLSVDENFNHPCDGTSATCKVSAYFSAS